MCVYVLQYISYVSEESLIKQLQNIASNMEEHRRIMDNFTNKKNILKHEEENIGREIRSINLYIIYYFQLTVTMFICY